ncbi:hypothetical protein L1047_12910 [Synechococcus sp. Nb3U1]|uniref:hypothetical protein n=1 Tax=Synechococcus sp. Nb3U1 TaxID=1914529 RepID=UPI001F1A5024|nr:hypothetical protein [Synechococcus sp. Nb3U1]MCF2972096.1 hypothetical protein [Synechococcus sp. Nb3U1]
MKIIPGGNGSCLSPLWGLFWQAVAALLSLWLPAWFTPPPSIPVPEPPEPNLNEMAPPPIEVRTSVVVVAGVDIPALPASEIDLLLASGAVVAISAKFVPLLLSLLPGVGVVALATAGVTVVYIYTDSIRELNVQAARQGVELNVGLVTTRLAVPPDEPLFLPLPEYELTDAFQNRIPVALPLPSFPLPEAPPTLPETTILDPEEVGISETESFPAEPSRVAEIWTIRQSDPHLSVTMGSPFYEGIISPQREKHILYSDASGGRHLSGVGNPGKTEFPPSWTPQKIPETAADLATRSGLGWLQQNEPGQGTIHTSPSGPRFTNAEAPVRYLVMNSDGSLPVVDGVTTGVVIESDGEGIITAVPISGSGVIRNP